MIDYYHNLGLSANALRAEAELGDWVASYTLLVLINLGLADNTMLPKELIAQTEGKSALGDYLCARTILGQPRMGQPMDHQTALHVRQLFQNASDQGVARASTLLGLMLEAGIGGAADINEAINSYRLATQKNDELAWGLLGSLYVNNSLTDSWKGLECLENAVSLGHWESAPILANIYLKNGQDKDLIRALEILKCGAEKESFGCLTLLSSVYRHGLYGEKKNSQLAEALSQRSLTAAAKIGNALGLKNS